MSLKGALAFVYWSLLTFPLAATAWGLMWITDRLYDKNITWLGAILRVITFIMQAGVLITSVTTIIGFIYIIWTNFFRASRGLEAEKENPLKVKGYILLLLIPLAMGVSTLLIYLFNIWLDFGNHGLGLITISYMALDWVLEIGSLVAIVVWLIILPLFLHNRKKLLNETVY